MNEPFRNTEYTNIDIICYNVIYNATIERMRSMFMKNRNRLDEQKNEIWIGKKNRNGEKVQIGHFKRILSISCFLSVFLLIAFTFCWLKIESVKGETKVYKVACIKEPGYFEYDSEESPYGYCAMVLS